MAGETTITLVGNLTADPELRFTPSGAAVANFTVASTPRTFDRQSNEWRDGDAMFLHCAVWRQAGGNVAGALQKGMRVRSEERRVGEECRSRMGPDLFKKNIYLNCRSSDIRTSLTNT